MLNFQVFKSKGVDMSRPLIGSCMTSVMASSLSLAAHSMDIKMPVYQVIFF
jgi:3-mercaptopyruvate sulfurtransferase SseA